jgi:hypothetical protein
MVNVHSGALLLCLCDIIDTLRKGEYASPALFCLCLCCPVLYSIVHMRCIVAVCVSDINDTLRKGGYKMSSTMLSLCVLLLSLSDVAGENPSHACSTAARLAATLPPCLMVSVLKQTSSFGLQYQSPVFVCVCVFCFCTAGDKPKLGSQHRSKAEPAGAVVGDKWIAANGGETLMGKPPGPFCRDLTDPPPPPPQPAA